MNPIVKFTVCRITEHVSQFWDMWPYYSFRGGPSLRAYRLGVVVRAVANQRYKDIDARFSPLPSYNTPPTRGAAVVAISHSDVINPPIARIELHHKCDMDVLRFSLTMRKLHPPTHCYSDPSHFPVSKKKLGLLQRERERERDVRVLIF